MEYFDQIADRDVWVTVQRPFVRDQTSGKYVQRSGWCAAFKFDKEPGVVIGEYVRGDDKQLRWYPSPDDAAEAAFTEAAKRLDGE